MCSGLTRMSFRLSVRLALTAFLTAGAVAVAACDSPAPDGAARPPQTDAGRLDEAVTWVREFPLEENENTINVMVRAGVDPRGGFLIADEQEGYARRYDEGGRLLAQFAGKGAGPDEFTNLLRVLRLRDGTLAAFDIFHKVAFFDSTGQRVLRTTRTPVGPLHSVTLLDDSLVLLAGQHGSGESRLHVWNLRRDSVVSSFFAPPLPSRAHVIAATTAGWVGVDHHGDTLAVVSSLSDTVYLMTTRGDMLERIPIPSETLRRLDPDKPLPDGRGGIVGAREWFSTFSLISDVFWIGNRFVVQFQDRLGPQPHWRLVGMTRDGQRTFEVVDTPNLLAVDRTSGLLYFVAPNADAPNVWRAARLR